MTVKQCLPERITGTVPEARRQRHCARGAAAGGLLYACPLIRVTGAADFGRRPTGGGAGVKGFSPCGFFPLFLVRTRNRVAVGRLPTNYAAH